MSNYYSNKLYANHLKQCYEIAPIRVQQYLEAEVNHVIQKIHPGDMVLELGCGYGRVLLELAKKAKWVIGIDTSFSSLLLGLEMLKDFSNCFLMRMNAIKLAFRDSIFDKIVCVQNGISAFHVNRKELIRESIRVAKPGGTVLFSSYSDKFWDDRLEWFKLQIEAGLLGEIDYEKTQSGVIICKDGFKATTVQAHQFLSLTRDFDADIEIVEVDESSMFCEIFPNK